MSQSVVTALTSMMFLVAAWGAFVSISLLLRSGERPANRPLAAMLICVTLIAFHHASYSNPARAMAAVTISLPLWFLVSPLYYFHVLEVTGGNEDFPGAAVHFFPAVFSAACVAVSRLSPHASELGRADAYAAQLATLVVLLLHMLLYAFLSLGAARDCLRDANRGANGGVGGHPGVYAWATLPFLIFVFFTGVAVCVGMAVPESRPWIVYVSGLGMGGLMVASGVAGMRSAPGALEEAHAERNRRLRIAVDEAELRIRDLKQVMETERLFLRGDLRLPELATRLGMSTHNLSQLLNQNLEVSFSDFVNRYRVEYAMRRIDDPSSRDFTLVAIAREAGFSSKTSFNRAFKKVTGKTPSEYQKGVAGDTESGGAATIL